MEQARELDDRIKKAWMGHHKFVVVDNSGKDFATKMSCVVSHVLDFVGESSRSHSGYTKRKFVIKELPNPFPLAHEEFEVDHDYLMTTNKTRVRLRRRGQKGELLVSRL